MKKFFNNSLLLALTISTSSFLSGDALFSEQSNVSKLVSQDFTSVAKKAIPSVVSIRTKQPEQKSFFDNHSDSPFDPFGDDFFSKFFGHRLKKPSPQEQPFQAQASGFLVTPDGHILTNNHVVKNAGQITVLLNDGRELKATVVGQDPNTDLAVIKVEGKDLPHLDLGNSDLLEVGQWVVAIGNPLGLQASLTVGVVSAKGRSNLDIAQFEDFIQTDAAINRGNSGGPLLNLDGEVVGINTAIASTMGGYMGIGFAIPSNMAFHVMNQLINNGSVTRGYLGVNLQAINHDLAQAFGLEHAEGALVADVRKGSPATLSDIRQGDVIISYNGIKVYNIASLRNAISMMDPGSQVKLALLREGKLINVTATIGNFPKDEELIGDSSLLGFEIETLTPEIAKNLGLLNEKGVVVSKVNPGSTAAWAGIKKGTLITEINKQKVSNTEEFYQALKDFEKGRPLLLLIKQDGQTKFLSIKIN